MGAVTAEVAAEVSAVVPTATEAILPSGTRKHYKTGRIQDKGIRVMAVL